MSTNMPPDIAALPFEQAMKELDTIVTELERGDVSLEKSIEKYERGEHLKKRCEALLAEAEMRINKISLGADGKPAGAAPLDPES
ncbi:MAG: exodeoxyribonuclease VII small subunit [Proteobacteria bacterium]|nr:exodeoxyribonuclease VII small subunit [Pseudomonadota bacterium]